MHTNAERPNKVNRRGMLILGVILFVTLLLLVIGMIRGATRGDNDLERTAGTNYHPKNKGADSGGSTVHADTPDAENLEANNTRRKNDASLLASRAVAYKETHDQQLPTGYSNGSLTGPGGSPTGGISLQFYDTVSIASGAHAPLDSDRLVLVNNAACIDNGGTIVQRDDLVVLYTQETSPGHFSSVCLVT